MDSDNSSNHSHSSAELQQEDPGAYPIPFRTDSVRLGSRLDSIPRSLRYWAVNEERVDAPWYNQMVEANNRYEEWLTTRPPGEYPVPFAEGKRLDEIEDNFRDWGIHPDRSSSPWYYVFVRANARYEQHLVAARPPDKFFLPRGIHHKYAGVPIEDIPQDVIWWGLRPSNRNRDWYQPLYDANKRLLDDLYKSRSPGSEPIWFGKRYRGLRLDQAYERKDFIRWCFDPKRPESGWLHRFKDLVHRLEDWRLAHPERRRPRQPRKAPYIQNPVGEAIGPWDDSPGSADEDDEYDKDGFVQSDSDELEYSSDSDKMLVDDGGANGDFSPDSDESASSSVEMTPSAKYTHKRRRTNVILSDEEESEEADTSATKLGRRYRLQCESSEEEDEVPVRKASKRMQ